MFFTDLPNELKLAIFSYCDAKTLSITACTSKDWLKITEDDALWQKEVNKLAEDIIEKEVDDNRSWKAIYINGYKNLQGLADTLYRLLVSKKPEVMDLTSDYANSVIDGIVNLYDDAISERALTRRLLAKYPQLLTQEDNHNHTILHWLVASGLPDAVEIVLEKAQAENTRIYSLNETEGYRLIDSRNKEGFTPLHFGLINCPREWHDNLVKVAALCLQYNANLGVTDAIREIDFQQELDESWQEGLIDEEHYQSIVQLINAAPTPSATL